jgi:hypothetical protein
MITSLIEKTHSSFLAERTSAYPAQRTMSEMTEKVRRPVIHLEICALSLPASGLVPQWDPSALNVII